MKPIQTLLKKFSATATFGTKLLFFTINCNTSNEVLLGFNNLATNSSVISIPSICNLPTKIVWKQ